MREAFCSALIAGLLVAGCGDDTTMGGHGGGGRAPEGGGATGGTPTAGGGGEGGMPADPVCGDGSVDVEEQCDDVNSAAGDGCDADCNVELGFECAGEPSFCATDCGDGILIGAEACDDGNDVAQDGCNLLCTAEVGYQCEGEPSVCVATCGDGVTAVGVETCDDGNLSALDGCAEDCAVESGYSCAGQPSVCMSSCGDGVVAGTEACDDSNGTEGDGCSGACAVESGFACAGNPSVCETTCGDGLIAGTEGCDDSNLVAGDCCSGTCAAEAGCETEPNNTDMTADDFAGHQLGGTVNGFVNPPGDANFYAVTLFSPGTVTARTLDGILGTTCSGNGVDSRIRILDALDDVLVSDDDGGEGLCSLATTGLLEPGTYFVAVDATPNDPTLVFDYALDVSVDDAVCGDNDLDPGETCDDGNITDGDGCSAICQIECSAETEPNNTSATADVLAVPGGSSCAAIDPVADVDFFSFTTSSVTDVRVETFDATGTGCVAGTDTVIELRAGDGTTVLVSDNDGAATGNCSLINPADALDANARHLPPGTYYVRVIESGNNAAIASYRLGVTFTAVCGDNLVEGFEECDGGPTCTASCDRVPICGDGFVDAPEMCDGGNAADGDGCSATCEIEGLTAEVEPNNTTAEADASTVQLTGDAKVSGSITDLGDENDFFRLVLTTDQVVRLETFTGLNECAAGTTTALRLLTSTGTLITSDTTAGIQSCSAIVRRLTAGTYYLQVQESGTNGSIPFYYLEVALQTDAGSETEANDTFAAADANLGAGDNVHLFGDHTLNADEDWYTLTVPQGGSIRAEVLEGGALTCESFDLDSRLTLYGPDGVTQLVDDSNDGRGFCSQIDGTGNAPKDAGAHDLAAGTYYLQLRASTASQGMDVEGQFIYRLQVTVRAP